MKYVVETKRLFKGWSRGAVWLVLHGDFREFLAYINGCDNRAGGATRIKRVPGGEAVSYYFPEDRL